MVTEKTVEELRDEVKACQGRWVLTAKGLDETLDNSALGLLLWFISYLQQAEVNCSDSKRDSRGVTEPVDSNCVHSIIEDEGLGSTGRAKHTITPTHMGPNPYLCYA